MSEYNHPTLQQLKSAREAAARALYLAQAKRIQATSYADRYDAGKAEEEAETAFVLANTAYMNALQAQAVQS